VSIEAASSELQRDLRGGEGFNEQPGPRSKPPEFSAGKHDILATAIRGNPNAARPTKDPSSLWQVPALDRAFAHPIHTTKPATAWAVRRTQLSRGDAMAGDSVGFPVTRPLPAERPPEVVAFRLRLRTATSVIQKIFAFSPRK
jgi:hypothetical protein